MIKVSLRKHDDGTFSHPKLNGDPLNVEHNVHLVKLIRMVPSDPKYKMLIDVGFPTEYTVFFDTLSWRYPRKQEERFFREDLRLNAIHFHDLAEPRRGLYPTEEGNR